MIHSSELIKFSNFFKYADESLIPNHVASTLLQKVLKIQCISIYIEKYEHKYKKSHNIITTFRN